MPLYSPAQSDIDRSRDPEESERAHADLENNGANATATKWVYILMFILLAALVILTMYAHSPPTEG